MAVGHEPLTPRRADGRIAAGVLALAALAILIGGAFAGLTVEAARNPAGAFGVFDAYVGRVLRFTLFQATLSTVLSILPALLVARSISRHPRFPGRSLVLWLFALPLALPAIVAALGIVALYGRAGIVADILRGAADLRWQGVYGLSGILVAHVFFNLPLATRLFLGALETVPADQWRLASQLGMNARSTFRLVEWPAMRAALPGIAGLVFMLCMTSFTVVLMLGGGPAATTLEVAIYQSLRFDFDPARAVALTLLQVAATAAIFILLSRLGGVAAGDAGLPVSSRRFAVVGRSESLINALVIVVAFVFVAGPMAAIVAGGLRADLLRLAGEPAFRSAALTSLVLATISASICVAMSFALVGASRSFEKRGAGHPLLRAMTVNGASLVLVVPPIVIGAGWFVLLRHTGAVFTLAPVMVATVNAAMAMPFAVRAIKPAYDMSSHRHDRLCAQLGIDGAGRLRLVDWPVLRRPLMTAFAFAMALSLGDLGVIALFGSDSVQTLPYLLYSRMASYRTSDAAGLALLLGALCLLLMIVADRIGRSGE